MNTKQQQTHFHKILLTKLMCCYVKNQSVTTLTEVSLLLYNNLNVKCKIVNLIFVHFFIHLKE